MTKRGYVFLGVLLLALLGSGAYILFAATNWPRPNDEAAMAMAIKAARLAFIPVLPVTVLGVGLRLLEKGQATLGLGLLWLSALALGAASVSFAFGPPFWPAAAWVWTVAIAESVGAVRQRVRGEAPGFPLSRE